MYRVATTCTRANFVAFCRRMVTLSLSAVTDSTWSGRALRTSSQRLTFTTSAPFFSPAASLTLIDVLLGLINSE